MRGDAGVEELQQRTDLRIRRMPADQVKSAGGKAVEQTLVQAEVRHDLKADSAAAREQFKVLAVRHRASRERREQRVPLPALAVERERKSQLARSVGRPAERLLTVQ